MYRVRTIFTAPQGSPWYSNLYFAGAEIGGDPQSEIDAVEDFWNGFGGSLDNSVTVLVEGDVAVVDDFTGNLLSVSSATPRVPVFSATGAPLPRSQQALCRWATQTYIGGRRLRGRTFVPGVMTANMTEGRPDPSVVAAYGVVGQALVTDSATQLVVWHRPDDSGSNGSSHLVTDASFWSEYAVLRSRRD